MYQYALTKNEKLIDIEKLTKENKDENEYVCISCGEKLIPKLGDINAHHFAHLDSNICSRETYLHKLGKLIFLTHYLDCLENKQEYNIEYQFTKECKHFFQKYKKSCTYQEEQSFNLIDLFPQIKYQEKEGDFIPDLLLIDKNNKNKIFIEIFVSHRVTYEKIASKNRIIEICIKDEKDVELIRQPTLSYKDPRITFYNIQQKTVEGKCEGQCKKSHRIIYLNNEGVINTDTITLNELENESILNFYILTDQDDYNNDLYKFFSASCAKKNLPVRNCNICSYHMLDKYKQRKDEPIYCKNLKVACHSTEAESCEIYSYDYKIASRVKYEPSSVVNHNSSSLIPFFSISLSK